MHIFTKQSTILCICLILALGYTQQTKAVNCRVDTVYNYVFDSAQVKQLTGRIIYQYFANDLTKEYIKQSYSNTSNSWLNDFKSVYTYNANWKLSEQLSSQWDVATKQWKNSLQFLYDYDAAGNNITFTYNTWNINTDKWQGLARNNFSFDNANREIEFYNQQWDNTSKQWINQNKQEHVYDHLGRDTQFSTYEWDKVGKYWKGDKRTIQIYNANGQNTNTINRRFIPYSGTWDVEWQTSFTFNAYGLLVKRYVMAFVSNKWKPYQKVLYEYDSAKLCTVEYVHTNDTFIGVDTVYLNKKSFYQYDAKKRVIEVLIQLRNIGLNTFRNYYLTQTQFDAYNQKSEEIFSNWSIPLGKWLKSYRNINVFNSDTNLVKTSQEEANDKQQWVPSYETNHTFNANGQHIAVDRYSNWDTTLGIYTSHNRDEFKCKSAPITSISLPQLPVFKVYPNPSMGRTIHIISPWSNPYFVYNINGQLLWQGDLLEGDNIVELKNLSDGLYFIKCKNSVLRLCISPEL